jgi:hypothetical protein
MQEEVKIQYYASLRACVCLPIFIYKKDLSIRTHVAGNEYFRISTSVFGPKLE